MRDGLIYAVIAYTLWGMMPLYLKQVETVSSVEIVAHRVIWSIVFGAILIAARKQSGDVLRALKTPKIVFVLFLAAIFISLNWLIYVWAVSEERVLEASLGYFINPLMYVAAGVLVLRETLNRSQIIAIAIACIGVLILTVGLGKFPWVSVVLALLFTGYGYIRKTTDIRAMPGLFVETVLLAPIALIYLLFLWNSGTLTFASGAHTIDFYLILAGPVTVMPLLLFSLSARRLTMVIIGITQYIGPTLQFCFGIYFGEKFTPYHGVAFGLIWIALAIFTWDAVKASKPKTIS